MNGVKSSKSKAEDGRSDASLRRRGSLNLLLQKANTKFSESNLLGVALLLALSIATVNSLAFVVVEYAIFGGSTQWNLGMEDAAAVVVKQDNILGITNSDLTATLTNAQFRVYVGFIIYTTVMLTGLGLEVLVWLMLLQNGWSDRTENCWRLAQFAFPLFALTQVTLASTHNYLALPFLVAGLFKFGFPETILYTHAALYEKDHSALQRIMDGLNGVGTAIHHNCAVLYVSMLITGVLPADRYVLGVTIPLIMQHWFILLKYVNELAYVVVELILEAWFEWVALSTLENVHGSHWTGGLLVGAMLFAHWMYVVAACMGVFVTPGGMLDEDQVDRLHHSITLSCNIFDDEELQSCSKATKSFTNTESYASARTLQTYQSERVKV